MFEVSKGTSIRCRYPLVASFSLLQSFHHVIHKYHWCCRLLFNFFFKKKQNIFNVHFFILPQQHQKNEENEKKNECQKFRQRMTITTSSLPFNNFSHLAKSFYPSTEQPVWHRFGQKANFPFFHHFLKKTSEKNEDKNNLNLMKIKFSTLSTQYIQLEIKLNLFILPSVKGLNISSCWSNHFCNVYLSFHSDKIGEWLHWRRQENINIIAKLNVIDLDFVF